MDIKQLKYFQTIADAGSITGAASRLFMTQPSLSQQMKLLETDLGIKLFDRSTRKITLTAAGHLLQERAGQILDLLASTTTELQELDSGQSGTLAIGAITSSGATLLPGLLRQFHQRYPNIKFHLREGDTLKILELLAAGLIEIGFARSVFHADQYDWLPLPPDPMIVALHQDWTAALPPGRVTLQNLEGKPLLLHRGNETMFRDACQRAGFTPNFICLGDDVRTLLTLVAEGLGLAVVSKSTLSLIPGHSLVYREFSDPPFDIPKVVVWPRHKQLSASAKHFLATLRSEAP